MIRRSAATKDNGLIAAMLRSAATKDNRLVAVMLSERSESKYPPHIDFGFSKTACFTARILRQAQDDRLYYVLASGRRLNDRGESSLWILRF